MKISRNNQTVKLTLSRAEWDKLGKVAGWSNVAQLLPTSLPHKPKPSLPENIDPALAPPADSMGLSDSIGEDKAGTPPPAAKSDIPQGDTFLPADPDAPPVEDTNALPDDLGGSVDDLGLGAGDFGTDAGDAAGGDGWLSKPQQAGDYAMTDEMAGGLEQEVYFDGQGKVFFDGDSVPHKLEEVLQQNPGVKFKLKDVTEPDQDITQGGWGNKANPVDPTTAPF